MSDLLPEMIMPEAPPKPESNPPSPEVRPEPLEETPAVPVDIVEVEEPLEEPEIVMPVVKPIIEDEEIFKDPPVKKKRKATAKQLEHLKKAREKAQANKLARKKEKQAQAVIPEAVKKARPEAKHTLLNLSPEELEALTERAIAGYDTKRKAEKAEKRKQQAEDKKQQALHTTISRALKQPDPDDMWASCFNFQ